MKYGIKAYVIQDIGRRDNQEDSFFPPFIAPCHFEKSFHEASYFESEAHRSDSLFMVCDGLGGHEHGEVASSTVCKVMSNFILRSEGDGREFGEEMVRNATMEALRALNDADNADTSRKMGTTMTLLRILDDGATIAHIGDSRVYHFRPATKHSEALMLFRTEDHNVANMMLKQGTLSLGQVQNCRERHMLTRALMAGMDYVPVADIYHTRDIKPGDVFFLCSDGMVEKLLDEELCRILTSTEYSDEERMQILLNISKLNKDNHTAWFVRVERCGKFSYVPFVKPKEKRSLGYKVLRFLGYKVRKN